jgi:hypothetical protein
MLVCSTGIMTNINGQAHSLKCVYSTSLMKGGDINGKNVLGVRRCNGLRQAGVL